MFTFKDLVDEVIADFHDAANRMVNEVSADLAPLTADRRRVQDVLVNLIDNASSTRLCPRPSRSGPATTNPRSRSG